MRRRMESRPYMSFLYMYNRRLRREALTLVISDSHTTDSLVNDLQLVDADTYIDWREDLKP